MVGEGAFGSVYKAIHTNSGLWYALKEIRIESELEGIPSSAIREIAILKELQHPNIIKLINVLYTDEKLTLVYDLLDSDLANLLSTTGTLPKD